MTVLKTAAVTVLALSLGACAGMTPGPKRVVTASTRCTDQTVQIYFESFSAEVTKEGRAVLNLAAKDAKGCKVTGIDVLGLADAVGGTPDDNLELSKKRAQAVTATLTAAGLPAQDFKLAAAGQAGSVNKKGDARLLRRRADIVLHLAPL